MARSPGWLAIPLSVAVVGAALADDISSEIFMPEGGRDITTDFNLRGTGDDERASGYLFLRTPLWQGEESYLLLQGEGRLHYESRGVGDGVGGDGGLGLILRHALGPRDAVGLNAFVDLGSLQGFAGQASVGLEYEHLTGDGLTLRAGGNLYLPFADYTDGRDRSAAPRLGGDGYLGLGKDFGEHRLDLFGGGFYYTGTDAAESLPGAFGEVVYRWEGLADVMGPGAHLFASLGARWDRFDEGVSPTFGLGISLPLGAAADEDRVAELRRHLAFGSPFVPIDYKTAPAGGGPEDLGCGPGLPAPEQEVDVFLDLSNAPPESAPTVLDLSYIDLGDIEAVCQGFAACAADIAGFGPVDNQIDTGIIWYKPADTCTPILESARG